MPEREERPHMVRIVSVALGILPKCGNRTASCQVLHLFDHEIHGGGNPRHTNDNPDAQARRVDHVTSILICGSRCVD
jgi:hypothetical protein